MKFTKTSGKPKMLSISFSNFYVTVAPYFWSDLFVPSCLSGQLLLGHKGTKTQRGVKVLIGKTYAFLQT